MDECDSETGVTLGLIEGIIAQFRLLAKRDLSSEQVQEALYDMQGVKEVSDICYGVHHARSEASIKRILADGFDLMDNEIKSLKAQLADFKK